MRAFVIHSIELVSVVEEGNVSSIHTHFLSMMKRGWGGWGFVRGVVTMRGSTGGVVTEERGTGSISVKTVDS